MSRSVYGYRCLNGACNHVPRSAPVDGSKHTCPVCGTDLGYAWSNSGPRMERHAEWSEDAASDVWGVAPDQIAEAQRQHPHHRFSPDGRLLIGSHSERKRVLKDLGVYAGD